MDGDQALMRNFEQQELAHGRVATVPDLSTL